MRWEEVDEAAPGVVKQELQRLVQARFARDDLRDDPAIWGRSVSIQSIQRAMDESDAHGESQEDRLWGPNDVRIICRNEEEAGKDVQKPYCRPESERPAVKSSGMPGGRAPSTGPRVMCPCSCTQTPLGTPRTCRPE